MSDIGEVILGILLVAGILFIVGSITVSLRKKEEVRDGNISFERSEEHILDNEGVISISGRFYKGGHGFDYSKIVTIDKHENITRNIQNLIERDKHPLSGKIIEFLELTNDSNYYFIYQECYYWVFADSITRKAPMYFGDNKSTVTTINRKKTKAIDVYRISKLDQSRHFYVSYILGSYSVEKKDLHQENKTPIIVQADYKQKKDSLNITSVLSESKNNQLVQSEYFVPNYNPYIFVKHFSFSGESYKYIYYTGKEETIAFPKSITRISLINGPTLEHIKVVVIPSHINKVEEGAFCQCPSLNKIIVFEDNMHYYGDSNSSFLIERNTNRLIFACTNNHIPDNITEISKYAFAGRFELEMIRIPNSVKVIGTNAFIDCPKLKMVIIPSSVSKIDYNAFSSLSNVVKDGFSPFYWDKLEDSLELSIFIEHPSKPIGWDENWLGSGVEKRKIYWKDMWHYDKHNNPVVGQKDEPSFIVLNNDDFVMKEGNILKEYKGKSNTVVIPKNVIKIEGLAFCRNKKINTVHIHEGVTHISNSAFFLCENLEKIVVSPDNKIYDSRENSNSIIESATHTLITGCKTTVIPSSVKIIGPGAFNGTKFLEGIIIPDSVEEICSQAFTYCFDLKFIVIPKSVVKMGAMIFSFTDDLIRLMGIESPMGALRMSKLSSLNIFISFSEIPKTWDDNWNYNNMTVYFEEQWNLVGDNIYLVSETKE